jgi:hypothetical protein
LSEKHFSAVLYFFFYRDEKICPKKLFGRQKSFIKSTPALRERAVLDLVEDELLEQPQVRRLTRER